MADNQKTPSILFKTRTWSPYIDHDKEWEKMKVLHEKRELQRSQSLDSASVFDVTEDDIKELKGCFDLGFGFDPINELDPKLKQVFPALELYAAVNRQFNDYNNKKSLSRSSSTESDGSSVNSVPSSSFINDPDDDPKKVKMRLKRWAQVVACSVHEASMKKKPTAEVIAGDEE